MLQETSHNRIMWSVDSLFEIEAEAADTPDSTSDLRSLRAELRHEIAQTRALLREEFYGVIKHLTDDQRRRSAPLPMPW